MKNRVMDGNSCHTMSWTNGTGATVVSGQGVMVGTVFGIAQDDIANGATGVLQIAGRFIVPKASGAGTAFTQGQLAAWDGGNKRATHTLPAAGLAVGYATKAAADGDTEVEMQIRVTRIPA